MLSLARALLNDNRLLLVDEPTKGLAPRIVAETTDALARAAQATPIVLVEQNLAAVARLARHAVVMVDGRVAHVGPTADLMADPALTRRLLGVSTASGGAQR